jgi:hypothetical protein
MIVVYCDRGFYNDNDNCAACQIKFRNLFWKMRNVKNKVLKSVHENDKCKK